MIVASIKIVSSNKLVNFRRVSNFLSNLNRLRLLAADDSGRRYFLFSFICNEKSLAIIPVNITTLAAEIINILLFITLTFPIPVEPELIIAFFEKFVLIYQKYICKNYIKNKCEKNIDE